MPQIVRYAVVGGAVTALQAAVYWLLGTVAGWHPQIANIAGYATAVVSGYYAHGAITFPNGRAQAGGERMMRFAAVSLLSLAVNAFWVWLLIDRLDAPVWAPLPFMTFATPVFVFMLNRHWVYR